MFALCYHSDCYPLPPTQHSFFWNIPPLFVCHNASLIQNFNLKLTEFSNSKWLILTCMQVGFTSKPLAIHLSWSNLPEDALSTCLTYVGQLGKFFWQFNWMCKEFLTLHLRYFGKRSLMTLLLSENTQIGDRKWTEARKHKSNIFKTGGIFQRTTLSYTTRLA